MLSNYATSSSSRSIYLISTKNLLSKNWKQFNNHNRLFHPCCHSTTLSSPRKNTVVVDNLNSFGMFRRMNVFQINQMSVIRQWDLSSYKLLQRTFSTQHTTKKLNEVKVSSNANLTTTNKLLGSNEVTNKLKLDPNEWQTIYRFKYIRMAHVIQKLKIYQTGITSCLALPGSFGLYLHGIAPLETVSFMAGSSLFACGMLYIMGRFCSRLIGIIYVSKSDDTLVRIAHLNFWGKREDRIFKKTDFTPFSELPDNVSDIYINIRFYSEPDILLHLCVRYGTVYNKEEFEEIFGTHTGLEIHGTLREKENVKEK